MPTAQNLSPQFGNSLKQSDLLHDP